MDLNIEITPGMLALVPIVAALVQMVKRIIVAAPIPKKIEAFIMEFLPVVSMVISFLILLSVYKQTGQAMLPSIIVGLTASGGYSLMKGKSTPEVPKPSVPPNAK